MVSNSTEYMREYMKRKATEKVECSHCHKVYSKYSKYKHERSKYHKNFNESEESETILTPNDVLKLKALLSKIQIN